jgi:hypothetical protein
MDLKIFVLTDDDVRLARRIQRDIAERGRTVQDVLAQYNRFVKPSYDEFIKPTMKYADIIIPHGRSNTIAIDFVLSNLRNRVLLDDFTPMPKPDFISPEAIADTDSLNSILQIEVLKVEDQSLSQKMDALVTKVTSSHSENQDDTLYLDVFTDSIMRQLKKLRKMHEGLDFLKFDAETDLFLPELISEESHQSTVDLVRHGPQQKHFYVYTLVTDAPSLDSLQRTLIGKKI